MSIDIDSLEGCLDDEEIENRFLLGIPDYILKLKNSEHPEIYSDALREKYYTSELENFRNDKKYGKTLSIVDEYREKNYEKDLERIRKNNKERKQEQEIQKDILKEDVYISLLESYKNKIKKDYRDTTGVMYYSEKLENIRKYRIEQETKK